MSEGFLFPADQSGKRSTLAGGKAVWAQAARAVDPALADAILAEKNWRMGYEKHIVQLMEAGAASPEAAIAIAEAGLGAIYGTFDFVRGNVTSSIPNAMAQPSAEAALSTASVKGSAPPSSKLVVPYDGKVLEGDALIAKLQVWSDVGAIEPAAAAAISGVARGVPNLSGRVFVLLGATSALGPLLSLLAYGATIVAVARPKPESWANLIATARASAGTLVFPVSGGAPAANASDEQLAQAAGADLMVAAPEILAWLKAALPQLGGAPIVGMYTYLDSDAHVRVSIACDAIMRELAPPGSSTSLAYIQTPSLVYDLPKDAVDASQDNYRRSWLSLLGFAPNARPAVAGTDPARYVHDGLLSLQGPNYALAKTIQLWRAVLARSRDGVRVSANCAPPARTASMVAGNNKNAGTVATGLNGMGYFRPMACFDQETVSACMTALLVSDVHDPQAKANPATSLAHPYELFSHQAFHGGSFRVGIKPAQLAKLFYISGKLLGPASAL